MERFDQLDTIMRKLLAGNFAEAKADLGASGLPPLHQAVLKSLIEFEAGEVYVPSRVRWYEAVLWRIGGNSAFGLWTLLVVTRCVFLVLGALGLSKPLIDRLHERELSNMVHYRYTSMLKGFVYSLLLYSGASRKQKLYRAAMKSQLSHALALGGRLDLAERLSLEALSVMNAFRDQDLVAWTLNVEATSNLFMTYVYAGKHDERVETAQLAQEYFKQQKYVWSQMFFAMISLHSATECLNDQEMQRVGADLNSLLSTTAFQTRFGLRFSGYMALTLAMDGDHFNAQAQIVQSEELYRISSIPLERARYHYTRTLTELELQRSDKALHHAEKNISMLAHVQGGVHHEVEARLLRIEAVLRTLYARPQLERRNSQLIEAERELRRLAPRVKGSRLHDIRVRVLRIFVAYLHGDHRLAMERVAAIQHSVGVVSKRYEKVIAQLQPRADQQASPILSRDEIVQKQQFHVIEKLSSLTGGVDLRDNAVDFVKTVFGSKDVRLTVVPSQAPEQLYEIRFTERGSAFLVAVGADGYLFDIGASVISSVNIGLIEPILKLFATMLNIIKLNELENEKARVGAIAKTTQMLAHDVRKPFSMLKMGMMMLRGAAGPADVKKVLDRLVPEIDKAVKSVDGLIADVMEIESSPAPLAKEAANPEALIEDALGEIFRVYPRSRVEITYRFAHSHKVGVHAQKIGRVFSNILANALQAMNFEGEIWLETEERGGFVEFCIGNAGSVIAPDHLPKLFEAFFTSGKKTGTGLGLAIAHKLATAHGGKIWCESERSAAFPRGKVEFRFTLPVAADRADFDAARLPTHSEAITKFLFAGSEIPSGDVDLEERIASNARRLGRPVNVMVVDDESVYRDAIESFFRQTPAVAAAVNLLQAASSDEALQIIDRQPADLIISDVDLGPGSTDGFTLVDELRNGRKVDALICVHSNRMCPADHKTTIDHGADAFLPKPMARAHLLKLVLQAMESSMSKSPPLPEVAVIDDNSFILDAWKATLETDAVAHAFQSPEELAAKLAGDPSFLERLDFVVTDFRFDNSSEDGLDVARLVKRKRAGLPVFLSSDGEFAPSELAGVVDRTIAKEPQPLAILRSSHSIRS